MPKSQTSVFLGLLTVAILLVNSGCDNNSGQTGEAPQVTPMTSALTLSSPVRLDMTPAGDLLVSDSYREAVHVLDSATLQLRKSIRIEGEPSGIAVLGEDLLVGNISTHSVERFSLDGVHIATFASGIAGPTSIAVDENLGKVFVLDSAAKIIRVFDTSGNAQEDIPAAGQIPLDTPTAVAVDMQNQSLWVSDYGPFDPEGGALGFGKNGAFVHEYDYNGAYQRTLTGDFSRPQGVEIVGDEVFLTDCILGQVLVYDRVTLSPTPLRTYGSVGAAPGELLFPLDVFVNEATGDAFVANNQAGRIEVFQGVLP